ncbi:MAG: gliding motility protein GldN [Bacteroidales bacterium]|nr:gliding motility protein GldN [Bacteroidales bacterium]
MKKLLFCIALLASSLGIASVSAQTIIDQEDESNFNDFYQKTLTKGKQAIPYAYLRESDVVWETAIWRTIDFREKFNQFFYFPVSDEKGTNNQGRRSLITTVMQALASGEIEAFEDDDMRIPKDYQKIFDELNRENHRTVTDYDEWGDETGTHDTVIREEFDPGKVFKINLKEYWYIDKQDTRQKVRVVSMQFIYFYCKDRGDTKECMDAKMFWVPMNDMRVRNILVKSNAYDENNNNAYRTYDDVFIDRYFDSYVYRESNRFNREVTDYVTGTDAIIESQSIEDKVFNIESDMWEY